MRCRCWMLLGMLVPCAALMVVASCGSIPNDPDDVVSADVIGSWVLRNEGGDVIETVRFFDAISPAPITSPIEDPESYLWQKEAQGQDPFEILYGAYDVTRSTQLRLTIEWAGNENNTLVRSIPAGQVTLPFTLSGDTLRLDGVAYIKQP